MQNQRNHLAGGVALEGQRGIHHVADEVISAVREDGECRLRRQLGKERADRARWGWKGRSRQKTGRLCARQVETGLGAFTGGVPL